MALLVGGDLQIGGSGPQGSYFQGLVYTEGSFLADRITVVGTVIAAGGVVPGPVTLRESRAIQPPNSTIVVNTAPPGGNPAGITFNAPWLNQRAEENDLNVHVGPAVPGPGFIVTGGAPVGQFKCMNAKEALNRIVVALAPYSLSNQAQVFKTLSDYMRREGSGVGGGPPTLWIVDPSSFLSLQERMRVVLWRELE